MEEEGKVNQIARETLIQGLRLAKLALESQEPPALGVGEVPQAAALKHVEVALWHLGVNL